MRVSVNDSEVDIKGLFKGKFPSKRNTDENKERLVDPKSVGMGLSMPLIFENPRKYYSPKLIPKVIRPIPEFKRANGSQNSCHH